MMKLKNKFKVLDKEEKYNKDKYEDKALKYATKKKVKLMLTIKTI